MRLSRIASIGLVALTALAVSTPNVAAHNPAKYAGILFVVPVALKQNNPLVSAQLVNVRGIIKLLLHPDNNSNAGFDVFITDPTAIGPSQITGSFPEGMLTFQISGFPQGATIPFTVYYTDGSESSGDAAVINGVATVPANAHADVIPQIAVEKISVRINGGINVRDFLAAGNVWGGAGSVVVQEYITALGRNLQVLYEQANSHGSKVQQSNE